MKSRLFLTAIFFMAVLCVSVAPAFAQGGFDQYGYNRQARVFVGTARSWGYARGWTDAQIDAYFGMYADDMIVMKWNAEWDRGNADGWSNPPYGAWENNEWNGRCVQDGSGEVWHYKIKWFDNSENLPDYTPLPDGGYVLWSNFEVILDHGSWSDHTHEFLAHAIPCGYGAP